MNEETHYEIRPCSSILEGQSNEIFYLQFFSSVEPVWATDSVQYDIPSGPGKLEL